MLLLLSEKEKEEEEKEPEDEGKPEINLLASAAKSPPARIVLVCNWFVLSMRAEAVSNICLNAAEAFFFWDRLYFCCRSSVSSSPVINFYPIFY